MKTISFIFLIMSLSGGFAYFWKGAHEIVSGWFGCMRYTYAATVWEYDMEDFEVLTFKVRRPLDDRIRNSIPIEIARKYPESTPFAVVCVEYRGKESVLWRTLWAWINRACTRTADDAVCEWKQQNGMAV